MTKIAAAGDFHFGNPRINCSLLYNELRASFYPEVDTSDLVLLTGDLFDQLVTVNSDANCFISKFIRELFVFSAKSHVPIRILHGTYSHDRNQLNVLNELGRYDNTVVLGGMNLPMALTMAVMKDNLSGEALKATVLGEAKGGIQEFDTTPADAAEDEEDDI